MVEPSLADGGRADKSPESFRTIREVSEALDVPQHVLRFWETKFKQLRPLKRGGGRRYYRPEDFALLQDIRKLLYTDGYTIRGVQKLLRDNGGKLPDGEVTETVTAEEAATDFQVDAGARGEIEKAIEELTTLREMLRGRMPS
jgi:DNA-binding transcriptional MerR regulator